MHEMSYCESVVQAVERRAGGRPVDAVGVRIGSLHRIVAAAFQQSFSMAATGGVAAEAVTELVVVPVRTTCRNCGQTSESDSALPACSSCGSLAIDRSGGDEVTLEWIRYRSDPSELIGGAD